MLLLGSHHLVVDVGHGRLIGNYPAGWLRATVDGVSVADLWHTAAVAHSQFAVSDCFQFQAVVVVVIVIVVVGGGIVVIVGGGIVVVVVWCVAGGCGVVVGAGRGGTADRCVGGFHATFRFPLSRLNAVLLHGVRPVDAVQLKVETARVANRLAQSVATPQ